MAAFENTDTIPVINISSLSQPELAENTVQLIGDACRHVGFFYVIGHGVPRELQHEFENLSQQFFSLSLREKVEIDMKLGGKAWRGYFAVGDEVTSGIPDQKEGLLFSHKCEPSRHNLANVFFNDSRNIFWY